MDTFALIIFAIAATLAFLSMVGSIAVLYLALKALNGRRLDHHTQAALEDLLAIHGRAQCEADLALERAKAMVRQSEATAAYQLQIAMGRQKGLHAYANEKIGKIIQERNSKDDPSEMDEHLIDEIG